MNSNLVSGSLDAANGSNADTEEKEEVGGQLAQLGYADV